MTPFPFSLSLFPSKLRNHFLRSGAFLARWRFCNSAYTTKQWSNKAMKHSRIALLSRFSKTEEGKRIQSCVLDNKFWHEVTTCIKRWYVLHWNSISTTIGFGGMSGLVVNAAKSSIFFGGVGEHLKQAILLDTRFSEVTFPFKYIGEPLSPHRLLASWQANFSL